MTEGLLSTGMAIGVRELANTFLIYYIFRRHLRCRVLYFFLFFVTFFLGEMGYCLWRGAMLTVREMYFCGLIRVTLAVPFFQVSLAKYCFAVSFLAYSAVLQNNIAFTLDDYYRFPFAPEQTANVMIILINGVFVYPLACLMNRFGEYLERTTSTRLLALASVITYSFLLALATQQNFGRLFNLEYLTVRMLVLMPGILFLGVMLYLLQELDTNRQLSQSVLALQELYDKEHDYYRRVEDSGAEVQSLQQSVLQRTGQLLSLIEAKDYPALEEYFNSLLPSAESLQQVSLCGHPVVDSMVGYWQLRAEEKNIDFCADIHVSSVNVDDQDLAIVLGNTLENAFTAACCVTEGPRSIGLKLAGRGGLLVLVAENSFNGECVCRDNQFYSAKRGFTVPGTGIANVRLIVEKYQGYSDIGPQGDRFVVRLGLPNRRLVE